MNAGSSQPAVTDVMKDIAKYPVNIGSVVIAPITEDGRRECRPEADGDCDASGPMMGMPEQALVAEPLFAPQALMRSVHVGTYRN